MSSQTDVGNLKTNQWDQLQDVANRFEESWSKGQAVELEYFMPPPGNPVRLVVLHELIKIDLEMRWQRGQEMLLEQYLTRFPELGTARTLPVPLIHEEYHVRRKYDKNLRPGTYQDRFPAQFAELQRLIRKEAADLNEKTVINADKTPGGVTPGQAGTPPPAPTPGAAGTGTAPAPPTPNYDTKPTPSAVPGSGIGVTAQAMLPLGSSGYKMLNCIGSGGFGEVWRAEAPGGIEVAIKMLFRSVDHEEGRRELQSLELIKRLRHPFLLATQAYFPMNDRLYIVMELADGSLRDRLKECRKAGLTGIPAEELIVYAREAGEALDFLHGKQVLHRDIKPENILLLQRHAKLADFGLAKLHEATRNVTATGSGTPAYMAPEMWRSQVSEHSDQYCLAVTYAELRLDRRLFVGTNMLQLMMEHMDKMPDLMPLEDEEQKVLFRALAKKPEERFPNCKAFVAALEEALGVDHRSISSSKLAAAPAGTAGAQPDRLDSVKSAEVLFGMSSSKPKTEDRRWRTEDVQVPWGKPGKKGPWLWIALLALAAAVPAVLFGLGVFSGPVEVKGEPSFTLETPPALSVRAGETKAVPIHIRRDRFDQSVAITFEGVPRGAVLKSIEVKSERVQASLAVDLNALPSKSTVTVRAEGGEVRHRATFELTIAPPNCFMRPGWERPAGARVVDVLGTKYYDQVDVVKDGAKVRFLLMRKQTENDPPAFYIMENKASVALFRQFAAANPQLVKGKDWEKKGLAGSAYPRDKQPVLGVTALEAYHCARWLNGNLPTRKQWDKAAGRFESKRPEGPFQGTWDKSKADWIALNRGGKGPMDCGEAAGDIGPLGCRDMAGNGREWTRDLVLDKGPVEGLLKNPEDRNSMVHLRGKSYAEEEPFRFQDLDNAEKADDPDIKQHFQRMPDIGFRVVIEPF